jgi:nucleotide-binding universal stress UspA family protein
MVLPLTSSALLECLAEDIASLEAQAYRFLDGMATWLDREGITTSVEVRLGDPVAAVLATAQDTGADVLALPTPWRIGGRMIAVDISRRLLYRAPLPVLIGRLACWWPTTYRHLLVLIDFGSTTSFTLRTALALARWHQAQVTVLHVLPPSSATLAVDMDHISAETVTLVVEEQQVETQERLTAILKSMNAGWIRPQVVIGEPVAETVKAAVHLKTDLVIMGSRRRPGLWRFLGQCITAEVARHTPCPVLVVKAPARTVWPLRRRSPALP